MMSIDVAFDLQKFCLRSSIIFWMLKQHTVNIVTEWAH